MLHCRGGVELQLVWVRFGSCTVGVELICCWSVETGEVGVAQGGGVIELQLVGVEARGGVV